MTDSEIQRLRAKLEAERARRRGLESVMRRSPDLVARFDREHRHLFVNTAVERAAGKPAEAFLGKTNEELGMPPELCRLWATGLEDVFQSGREQVVEFEFPGPDGARIYQSRIVPERDDDGTVQSVLGITREITDLKQAERAARQRAREAEAQHRLAQRVEAERERLMAQLELERSQLQGMFDRTPAMVAVVRGPDHVYELSNPANNRVIGERHVVGRPVREVLPALVSQGLIEVLDRVYASGEPFEGQETRIVLSGGPDEEPRELFLNFVFQPLFDPDGSVSGVFFHGIDVTQLVRAREAAQAANQAKSEFLATISHELRTPLHAIVGYAELLLAGVPEPLAETTQYHVERVLVSARHLNQLIEEVLTFSRLEAGREEVLREPVRVADLVEEVTAIIEPLAQAKGLGFRVEPPPRALTLETDPRKLRQILLNLASNAVKFTERGHIHTRTQRGGDELCVELSDTGVGIDPADHERIFEPFWQGEAGATGAGGTGLGLSVARRFARMLGGDIEVWSARGEGATFTVRLPLVAPDPPQAAGVGEPVGSGGTVAAGSGGTVPAGS